MSKYITLESYVNNVTSNYEVEIRSYTDAVGFFVYINDNLIKHYRDYNEAHEHLLQIAKDS